VGFGVLMGGYSDTYSDIYDPPFPQSILDTRVELLLGSTWTNVTSYVYRRDKVAITRGHPDESSACNPTVCSFTLNNRDGRFSPRNPTGAYYGNLTRNTVARVSVPEGGTYLRMEDDNTSYASCPDSASLHITGDIDIQIEMWLSDSTRSSLASKDANAKTSWNLSIDDNGNARIFLSNTGSGGVAVESTAPLPLGHIALRVTFAAASSTVTFYTASTIAGPWTQLGSAVVTSVTSLFASTAPLLVGALAAAADTGGFNQTPRKGANGKIYAFKLLSGIGGTVVASPTFTAQSAGTTSFADAQGNIWTVSGTAEVSDRKYRAHTEVPAWPPRWDPTGTDVYAPIQGSGRLRRLQAGTPPSNSSMYRAYVRITGSLAPVAYWPCEDGSTAKQLASGLSGGSALGIIGTPTLAADSSFACSQPLPTMGTGSFLGAVPAYTGGVSNVLRFLLKIPSSSPPADQAVLARLYTLGTVAMAELRYTVSGGLRLLGYNASNAQLFDSGAFAFGVLDENLRVSVDFQPSGGNVNWAVTTVQPGASTGLQASGSIAGSIGNAVNVTITPNQDCSSVVIGHVSVQAVWDTLFDLGPALNAWSGESAAIRFARLCSEEGIAYRVVGAPSDSVLMGPQTVQTVAALLQECEDADKGLIFEPRQCFGLGYRTRVSMFNQGAAVALTYTSAHLSPPVEPTDDDQFIMNDVTVTRTSAGSFSRQTLTSGALSTQAPPNGIGVYQQAKTQNLSADTQLNDAAGWLLWLGTVDDVRYPTLTVDLSRSELASLYYQVQDADIGDRITVGSTPSWLPPDGISQIMRGVTEVCFGYFFNQQFVCVPESPYRVGVLDDVVLGRADTDGSTLQTGINSTATSMSVATTDTTKPLWTTSAGDFPFDIEVGGERMTVTNITGTTSPQTFTVTRSVNGVVKSQSAGADVRLFQPAILSM
jgi:hypothetical protein